MNENTDAKADLRAWLFQLLAELETAAGVEATRIETSGRKVTLEIQFKI